MIKVKVELWPGGRPAGMKELGEITIANVGDLATHECQYDVILRDYATRDVAHGAVTHDRRRSVWLLLLGALDALAKEGELPILSGVQKLSQT